MRQEPLHPRLLLPLLPRSARDCCKQELLLAAINADFNYAGNLAEDTVYGWVFTDTDGELLNGNHSYAITVDPAVSA